MREIVDSIAEFVDAVNRGDRASVLARLTDDVSIIEDLAPYRWQGPEAGSQWLDAMAENARRNAITSISMNLRNATRVEVDGEHAYAIFQGVLTYGGGSPRQADGLLTFAMVRQDDNWMIRAFAWTGPEAVA